MSRPASRPAPGSGPSPAESAESAESAETSRSAGSAQPVTGLSRRAVDLVELMDDPDCDLDSLHRTYRDFRVVNALVSGWRRVYIRHLRPVLRTERTTSLLDVGCGGGDVPLALARWAARDGLDLQVTAIDPDPRAAAFTRSLAPIAGVTFTQALSSELVAQGRRFDVVTSNHLLHHLDDGARGALLRDSEQLATRLVVHNDIARSRLAYGGYLVGTLPWRSRRPGATFIHHDGLRSIRRSYTPRELAAVAPPGWQVDSRLPFRVLLLRATTPGTAHPPPAQDATTAAGAPSRGEVG